MNEEQLTKSIDALIDDLFTAEPEEVEKSIEIAKDADTTADKAVGKAPKAQKDEARGAGRPKQISDIPQEDMDGDRANEYDDEISENDDKETQPEETQQSPSIDQACEGKGRLKSSPKAPAIRPFKKSETGESEEISDEDWAAFQEFKKSQAEAEELKKAEEAKKEQEELVKSAVAAAIADVRKENEELRKSVSESQELLKAMASTPAKPKSITNVQALEKSESPEEKGPETFTKSEILDGMEELVKAGKLSDQVVYEYEMTDRVTDPETRKAVEDYMSKR